MRRNRHIKHVLLPKWEEPGAEAQTVRGTERERRREMGRQTDSQKERQTVERRQSAMLEHLSPQVLFGAERNEGGRLVGCTPCCSVSAAATAAASSSSSSVGDGRRLQVVLQVSGQQRQKVDFRGPVVEDAQNGR